MGIAVGIDLGTTNSCMAVVQANRAKVVADKGERRIHPSVVSFPPSGTILAGHDAKERQIIDPENTVYSSKRLIGRDLDSVEMKRVLEELPYDVHLGPGDIPSIGVRDREVSLPEMSAIMLRHLRQMCHDSLGVEVKDAVITVPANFDDVQRSMTKVAGRIAGFNVLRILNEPTAAALAYGFGGKLTERIAIYDFGGGTFDITIVELADDIFEVLSTAGDTYLGGDDFDKKIVEEMRSQFMEKHDMDLGGDNMAMQRIRSVAERVKCQLSTISEVQATLREIAEKPNGTTLDFHFKLDRPDFEKMVAPFVEKSVEVCDEALKLAGLDRSSLDNLVLVGGTTRIPMIRARVAQHFGMKPRTEINPDEVVAIGAAIQGFSLTGEQLSEILPAPAEEIEAVETDKPPKKTLETGHPPKKPIQPKRQPLSKTAAFSNASAPPSPVPRPSVPLQPSKPVSSVKKTVHGLVGDKKPSTGAAPLKFRPPLAPEPEQKPGPFGESELDIQPVETSPAPKQKSIANADTLFMSSNLETELGVKPLEPEPESELLPEPLPSPLPEPEPLLEPEPLPEPEPPLEPEFLPEPEPGQPEPPHLDPAVLFGDIDADMGVAPVAPIVEAENELLQDLPEPEPPIMFSETDAASDPAPLESPPEAEEPSILDSDPAALFGNVELDIDLDAPVESQPSLEPPSEDEAISDEFPVVLSVPPQGDTEHPSTDIDMFGALDDLPLPGAENDEIVGLPSTDQQHEDNALAPPVETYTEVSVPVGNAKPALLLDVTPRSLGVATAGGFCDTIIERNAAIPVEQSRIFTTSTDNQEQVSIDILQGESRRTEENTRLGQVQLTGIRQALRGKIKIRVIFEINTDGILGVSAINEDTKEAQNTRITLTGGMDDNQIEALVEKYADQ